MITFILREKKSYSWPGKELLSTFFLFVGHIITYLQHYCKCRGLVLDLNFVFIFLVCGGGICVLLYVCFYMPVRVKAKGEMLGVLIYHSMSYYFEIRSVKEPGARLAASKYNYFFCLYPHIVLGLKEFTTVPEFLHRCLEFEFNNLCLCHMKS